MNVKALAKSKRSHTKHNQPRKPHHLKPTTTAPPPPSSSTSNNNKPANPKKGSKEKPTEGEATEDPPASSSSSSLPSNWDRYEEEEVDPYLEREEEEEEEVLIDWSSGRPRVVTGEPERKSKGVGFVAPVKGPRKYPSISNHDFFDNFYQGFVSVLGAQSDGILSCDVENDCSAEDESTARKEHCEDANGAKIQKTIPLRTPVKQIDTIDTSKHISTSHLADEKTVDRLGLREEDIQFPSDGKIDAALRKDVGGSSKIEVDAAELELDALLKSFSETSGTLQISGTLNDNLDDLLESTSILNSQNSLLQSMEVKATTSDDATHGSQLKTGFLLTSSNLDSELDDLLVETSKFMTRQSSSVD